MAAISRRSPVGCDTFVAYPPDAPANTVIFGKNSDRPAGEGQSIRQYPGGAFESWWKLEKWSALSMSLGSYTPVIKHSNGKSPFSIGNTSSKGPFPIAMLDYRSVLVWLVLVNVMVMSRQTHLEIMWWNWCVCDQRGWCHGGLPRLIVDRYLQDRFNHEDFRSCCCSCCSCCCYGSSFCSSSFSPSSCVFVVGQVDQLIMLFCSCSWWMCLLLFITPPQAPYPWRVGPWGLWSSKFTAFRFATLERKHPWTLK